MTRIPESALVILVPEAEPIVKSFRDRYDPSAALGVPAHITILYPFIPPGLQTAADLAALQAHFAEFPHISLTLAELRCFPDALYLAPEPDEPIRRLIQATAARFPDYPPYGGEFPDIIPHLTVAQLSDPDRLKEVAADFRLQALGHLPIQVTAAHVALIDNATGEWHVKNRFSLGNNL